MIGQQSRGSRGVRLARGIETGYADHSQSVVTQATLATKAAETALIARSPERFADRT